jgi:methylenetetrahydrofolate reductase (NADPH)
MSLTKHYGPGQLGLSFELFPPKTVAGEAAMYQHVNQFVEFKPGFMTCTYGAAGSTRNKTLEIVEHVKRRHNLPVASHLTCVGSTVDQLRAYLTEAAAQGVVYVVALRGDPPRGETSFQAVAGRLRYAITLVALIHGEFAGFGIAVADYPETHQEALSPEIDLADLKRKVDAGVDIAVTQLIYDNADIFRFLDRCDAAGIRVPLVPGILPGTSLSQIQRMTSMCASRLPAAFVQDLRQHDDEDWQLQVGIDFATKQVQALIDAEVPGIHF